MQVDLWYVRSMFCLMIGAAALGGQAVEAALFQGGGQAETNQTPDQSHAVKSDASQPNAGGQPHPVLPQAKPQKNNQPVTFPDAWYEERIQEHRRLEGQAMPPLAAGPWTGPAIDLKAMRGKISVIHFWATWNQPSIQAMPHMARLAKTYADYNVQVVGVCMSGDVQTMTQLAKKHRGDYPHTLAPYRPIAKHWPIHWYPTYAVVDRAGIVRAIGLTGQRVGDAVEKLLQEEARKTGRAYIPAGWLEGSPEKRKRLKGLMDQAKTPPPLTVNNWVNADKPLVLDQLKGKVVVLDFLAPWFEPCRKAIPYHQKIIKKHQGQGLVWIGISTTLGSENIQEVIKQHRIQYPVCVDMKNKTSIAYKTNGLPDYYLIDRAGRLRVADCANGSLEQAVAALLAEPIPGAGSLGEKPSKKPGGHPGAAQASPASKPVPTGPTPVTE